MPLSFAVSAFYAECHNKHISLNGYIWTKSKFLGLSIGVHMIGQAVISVLDHEEEYILTFPNGYGRQAFQTRLNFMVYLDGFKLYRSAAVNYTTLGMAKS